MIDLKKEIKNLKGHTYEMSFPSKEDIDRVKEEKGIESVKISDLPRETVGNVILNSLSNYVVADNKEVFLVMATASWVNDESPDKEDLPEKLKKFLVRQVLPSMVYRKGEKLDNQPQEKDKGIYSSWVIAQVYEAMGVKEENE